MFSRRGMTVIPIFRTRILLTRPPMTFICDQILPRSLLAELTEYRWANWILNPRSESNPGT